MASLDDGRSSEELLNVMKRTDGVVIFSTGLPRLKGPFDDVENGLSLIVDFSCHSKTISRKAFFASLTEHGIADNVLGLAPLRAKNEWSISFKDAKEKDNFLQRKEFTVEGLSGEIRKYGDVYLHGKLYWLPLQFPQECIRRVLEHYGEIIRLERDIAVEDGCGEIYNGLRSFTLKLAENLNPEDLPHKSIIDGCECLFKIHERPSVCFRCAQPGHDAKFCPNKPKASGKRNIAETLAPYNYVSKAASMKEKNLRPETTQSPEQRTAQSAHRILPSSQESTPSQLDEPAQAPGSQPTAKKSKPAQSWAEEMEEQDEASDSESLASYCSSGSKSSSMNTLISESTREIMRKTFLVTPEPDSLQDVKHRFQAKLNAMKNSNGTTISAYVKQFSIENARKSRNLPNWETFCREEDLFLTPKEGRECGKLADELAKKYRILEKALKEKSHM